MNPKITEILKRNINFEKEYSWKQLIRKIIFQPDLDEGLTLVERYNYNNYIPVSERNGLLDQKLQLISENTNNSIDWIKYAKIAYRSTYGLESDNVKLLQARKNLLNSFIEYHNHKFKKTISDTDLIRIATIISHNFLQK